MRLIGEILLYVGLTVLLSGCGNPSRKKLSRILEQTETLVILSVPGRCKPHFYPSSEFNWDRMWEGVSEGTGEGLEEAGEWVFLGVGLLGAPVGALVGGVSKAYQMPCAVNSYYRAILWNAFEDRNPSGQVAQRIHTNCKERKPELDPQRVYWSDREGMEYRIASSEDRKAKMKEFYRASDSSGKQMLL
jgi:hypothetical protein